MAEVPEVPEVPQEAAAPETAAETNGSPPAEQAKPARTIEEVEAELAKTRREAANYRTKLREVEPIAKKALEAEEAEKTEVQKANERAQAAEQREGRSWRHATPGWNWGPVSPGAGGHRTSSGQAPAKKWMPARSVLAAIERGGSQSNSPSDATAGRGVEARCQPGAGERGGRFIPRSMGSLMDAGRQRF